MRYAHAPPHRHHISLLPRRRAIRSNAFLTVGHRKNEQQYASQQFVGQRILCNKAKKHFHFYPSRDARTVTVYAFVKTSTADLSPLIVSRP